MGQIRKSPGHKEEVDYRNQPIANIEDVKEICFELGIIIVDCIRTWLISNDLVYLEEPFMDTPKPLALYGMTLPCEWPI